MIEQLTKFLRDASTSFHPSAPKLFESLPALLLQVRLLHFHVKIEFLQSCAAWCVLLPIWIDTALERNTLMSEVYPKIKEYCREKHGLEFQVGRIIFFNKIVS